MATSRAPSGGRGTCLSRGREGRKVVKEPEHEERTQSTRGPSHNRFEKKNTYALTPQKLRRQKKASERMSEAEQKPPQPTRKGDELDAGVCRTHAQAPPQTGTRSGWCPLEPPRALGQAPARSSAAPLTKNWSIVSARRAREAAAAPRAVGTYLPRRDGRRPRQTSGSRPAPPLPPCFTRKLFLAPLVERLGIISWTASLARARGAQWEQVPRPKPGWKLWTFRF